MGTQYQRQILNITEDIIEGEVMVAEIMVVDTMEEDMIEDMVSVAWQRM